MLTINVVTLFPEVFAAPLAVSIPARAAAAGAGKYRVVPLRDYTHDRHHTVDDTPYGGGGGGGLEPGAVFGGGEGLGARAPHLLLSGPGPPLAHPHPGPVLR